MCFIRKQIRDTDHYNWKVLPTSFQVQTSAWSSCVLRNVNLCRFCLPSDCILFPALQMAFFFCFFILYPLSRYFALLSIRLPICGRNCSVMRRQCCRSVSFESLCTVHLKSIVQHLFHPEGRHIINVETYLVAAKLFVFKRYLRYVIFINLMHNKGSYPS